MAKSTTGAMRRRLTVAVAAAVTVGAGITQRANASLIAADPFLRGATTTDPGDPAAGEYDIRTSPTNSNLIRRADTLGAGQNPTIAGFTGPWTGNVSSATNAVAQWQVQFDGIVTSSFNTLTYPAGGRARFAGAAATEDLQRRVQRSLADYAPSDTYYMSFLSQVALGDANNDGFVGIGFTNGGGDANFANGSTTMRGLLIGAAGDGTGTDYVVRHQGAAGLVNSVILDDIVQGETPSSVYARHTVVKLEFNDDPTNPAGNSRITVWQDATDLSSEAAATAAAAPAVFRTFALGTNADITQLTLIGLDYTRVGSFDEPRLGTTWEVVVPEPASLGLVALAALALCPRRRRRARA